MTQKDKQRQIIGKNFKLLKKAFTAHDLPRERHLSTTVQLHVFGSSMKDLLCPRLVLVFKHLLVPILLV